MPQEDLYCCLTQLVFYDPVILPCKHVFEKEALDDYLEENQFCPDCKEPITDDDQIQFATDKKNAVNAFIKEAPLNSQNQYIPRYYLFNLLTKQLDADTRLILNELERKPELMAYFLWKCTVSSFSTELGVVVSNLINLQAFNEITINQAITKKLANIQQIHSASYLLLSNLEAREVLKTNTDLSDLIGEKLSANLLNQFVHAETHEGTLYYLLADEVGQKILVNHPNLKDRINHTSLSKTIISGQQKGKSLRVLYNELFAPITTPNFRC